MQLKNLSKPYITKDTAGIGGKIKVKPEDFIVEEIPAYEPSGTGEHLFIHLTKTGITTKEVQKVLARIFNTKRRDVEFAGIKDKHAIASQYFSVWLQENQNPELAYNLEEELPVTINSFKFHERKLKKGHLHGNQFSIKIREPKTDLDEAIKRITEIKVKANQLGIPNFYGDQRFGIEGDNPQQGLEILKGERRIPNKWLRQFLLSSFQSYLFNYYLTKRIREGLFNELMPGDIAKKHDTGGIFIVEDMETEQKRFDNKEICFTGPMFGKKMTQAKDEAFDFENSILEENEVTPEELKKAKLTGTRRAGIILPSIEAVKEEDGIRVKFQLPKGSFATIVLREIMKND
jgi:tRNA pseudouridine13 synthase